MIDTSAPKWCRNDRTDRHRCVGAEVSRHQTVSQLWLYLTLVTFVKITYSLKMAAEIGVSSISAINAKPVPMKLFSTWEVDKSVPSCIPRLLWNASCWVSYSYCKWLEFIEFIRRRRTSSAVEWWKNISLLDLSKLLWVLLYEAKNTLNLTRHRL